MSLTSASAPLLEALLQHCSALGCVLTNILPIDFVKSQKMGKFAS
jgi:hypothetical protein